MKLHYRAIFGDKKLTVLGVHDVKANGLVVGKESHPHHVSGVLVLHFH
jgi:hypothetical protein